MYLYLNVPNQCQSNIGRGTCIIEWYSSGIYGAGGCFCLIHHIFGKGGGYMPRPFCGTISGTTRCNNPVMQINSILLDFDCWVLVGPGFTALAFRPGFVTINTFLERYS